VERRSQAQKIAPQLVVQARQELTDPILQEQVLRFIQTIVLYKFPKLSTEEIKTMLNLDMIKHTRVYQEAKEEGRLEVMLKLLAKGFTIEEVANLLDLDVKIVREAAGM
jgi:predicted transposase YdaD